MKKRINDNIHDRVNIRLPYGYDSYCTVWTRTRNRLWFRVNHDIAFRVYEDVRWNVIGRKTAQYLQESLGL